MDTTKQSIVESQDIDHIAKVLENLDSEQNQLSATFSKEGLDFVAKLTKVDSIQDEIALRIVDLSSLDAKKIIGETFTLCAQSDHLLSFDLCEVRQAKRLEDELLLKCSLPLKLFASAKRDSSRVALTEDTPVQALLSNTVESPVTALVGDISIGGCSLTLPLSQCATLETHKELPFFALVFPNGEQFVARASIRYINPIKDSSYVALGLAFKGLDSQRQQKLCHIVHETEREIAWREGSRSYLTSPTQLYNTRLSNNKTLKKKPKSRSIRRPAAESQMLREKVVRPLHLFLLALRNSRRLPVKQLRQGADYIVWQLGKNRQMFLYALSFLSDEPNWAQHSVSVAARLGDIMLAEPEHAHNAPQAVMAALIHDLGKVLLIDEQTPSLEGEMNEYQRSYLRGHVETLLMALKNAHYPICSIQYQVISGINERIDGTGYPHGAKAEQLTALARMASVVDAIDAMTRRRGDRMAYTAIEAYRYLYQNTKRYDRYWVSRYVQRQGFYPIGSLVHYSRGYLAWVVALDDRGQINRLRVVKNIYLGDLNYDDEVSRVDFQQLGQLKGLVQPEKYGL